MTRVAAIDCGTNSIRLLVADVEPVSGLLTDLDRRMEIVRLGQGVDRTGEFALDALQRTFYACREFARIIGELRCERVRFVATSASRDVRNRDLFVAGVRDALGIEPEVVSGEEEAALSFAGATRELVSATGATARSPFLVVDIGGGSTEFVLGDPASSTPPYAASVDIGCVRLTERHLLKDPPSRDQLRAAEADVDAALRTVADAVPVRDARTIVGLAGSVTTVTAMALGLPSYQPQRIHHARVGRDEVHDVAHRLLCMPRAERGALPFMHPGRVDVIGAGALILSRVMMAVEVGELMASEHDILDGIAFSIA